MQKAVRNQASHVYEASVNITNFTLHPEPLQYALFLSSSWKSSV